MRSDLIRGYQTVTMPVSSKGKRIRTAILNKEKVFIEYEGITGRRSRREIEPKELLIKNDRFYVFAFCHKANEERIFKLAMLKVVEEGFSPKNGRCHLHGGASTGPRTAEGRSRIAAAQYKHGEAL